MLDLKIGILSLEPEIHGGHFKGHHSIYCQFDLSPETFKNAPFFVAVQLAFFLHFLWVFFSNKKVEFLEKFQLRLTRFLKNLLLRPPKKMCVM